MRTFGHAADRAFDGYSYVVVATFHVIGQLTLLVLALRSPKTPQTVQTTGVLSSSVRYSSFSSTQTCSQNLCTESDLRPLQLEQQKLFAVETKGCAVIELVRGLLYGAVPCHAGARRDRLNRFPSGTLLSFQRLQSLRVVDLACRQPIQRSNQWGS